MATGETNTRLVEFLLARIAEDEMVARAKPNSKIRISAGIVSFERQPSRVLAECEAKRRIMGAHVHSLNVDDSPRDCVTCGHRGGYCSTLRALALPYADHEDYRQEWKP